MDAVTEAERIVEDFLRTITIGASPKEEKHLSALPIAVVFIGGVALVGGSVALLFLR